MGISSKKECGEFGKKLYESCKTLKKERKRGVEKVKRTEAVYSRKPREFKGVLVYEEL